MALFSTRKKRIRLRSTDKTVDLEYFGWYAEEVNDKESWKIIVD